MTSFLFLLSHTIIDVYKRKTQLTIMASCGGKQYVMRHLFIVTRE